MRHPTTSISIARLQLARLATLACVVLAVGAALFVTARAWQASRTFLGNPFVLVTRTTPGPVVLEQIQNLRRLETSRYQGQVIVEGAHAGKLPTWLAGDRILFVARGEVVAGIDLSALQAEDVRVDGERLSLRLPTPQILHTRLDNHQSEVYERQTGIFTGPDRHLETRVRQEAEEKIRQAALEHGVLERAKRQARQVLTEQAQLLGFRDVRFL